MSLPNPTTLVSVGTTISLSDLLSTNNPQVLNRVNSAVLFRATQVQYQGYINLPPNSSPSTFAPFGLVTSWTVIYARNAGPSNVLLSLTGGGSGLINMDNGAVFVYISPTLNPTAISGQLPGFTGVGLSTSTTTQATVEILLAG